MVRTAAQAKRERRERRIDFQREARRALIDLRRAMMLVVYYAGRPFYHIIDGRLAAPAA